MWACTHTHTTHQQMPGCIHARLSSPPSQRFATSQCCLRLPVEVAQVAYATAPVCGRTVSGACLTFPVCVRLAVEVAQAAYGAESKLSWVEVSLPSLAPWFELSRPELGLVWIEAPGIEPGCTANCVQLIKQRKTQSVEQLSWNTANAHKLGLPVLQLNVHAPCLCWQTSGWFAISVKLHILRYINNQQQQQRLGSLDSENTRCVCDIDTHVCQPPVMLNNACRGMAWRLTTLDIAEQ